MINGATCILKKIQFIQRNNDIPSILWVLFDDKTIWRQWRVRYWNLYTEDINQNWMPNFAVDQHFKTRNAHVIQTQFPLKPAAGSTIHSGQGCTFDHICVGMDNPDSEGLTKNDHLARLFLQHAHYVAASRVTSLEGVQILSWNADLISVNKDVRKHMEYLHNERQVELCYMPVYVMKGLKCSFLNTRSLHRHIRSVQMNHNLCGADVVFLAETRLTASDPSDSYQIQGFQIVCRNDQDWNENSRPSHGIICYVRDTIWVLEIQKRSCEVFEAIFVCLQHTSLPIPVQLIGIYVAPECKYTQLIHEHFNMKSVAGVYHGYNRKLEWHMKDKFGFNQVIQQDTSNYSTVLDLCFTKANVQTSVTWNFWSDHRIVSAAL